MRFPCSARDRAVVLELHRTSGTDGGTMQWFRMVMATSWRGLALAGPAIRGWRSLSMVEPKPIQPWRYCPLGQVLASCYFFRSSFQRWIHSGTDGILSFRDMLVRCSLTVRRAIPRSSAICLLSCPATTPANTSHSRGDNCP